VEFLPKPFAESDLLEAIDQSLALDRQAMTQQDDLADLRARHDALTPREREVLALLLQGLRNKQSADRLGISEVTVKVHRHNVMEKMGATSLPALVDMLRRLGIRPPV
jgi:FixJ family two-component response regulator